MADSDASLAQPISNSEDRHARRRAEGDQG
jgi:hypothetical protein